MFFIYFNVTDMLCYIIRNIKHKKKKKFSCPHEPQGSVRTAVRKRAVLPPRAMWQTVSLPANSLEGLRADYRGASPSALKCVCVREREAV